MLINVVLRCLRVYFKWKRLYWQGQVEGSKSLNTRYNTGDLPDYQYTTEKLIS